MRKKGLAGALTNEVLPTVATDGKPLAGTILMGLEKAIATSPAATECGEPAAFNPGPASYQAGPIPTTDGALYLAAEILWPEIWPAAHNREVWGCRSDKAWRNDATGHSYGD